MQQAAAAAAAATGCVPPLVLCLVPSLSSMWCLLFRGAGADGMLLLHTAGRFQDVLQSFCTSQHCCSIDL
jgi:hypothetical protein